MFSVYVLKSEKDGSYYIGYTSDLKRRIKEHQSGLARYTRDKGPWHLFYQETFDTRREAILRERELKSYKSKKYLEFLARG